MAKLDEPGWFRPLRNFTGLLILFVIVGLSLVAVSPLSDLWFVTVSGLDPVLATMAGTGLWVALLWPPISVLRNTFQGVLVNGRKTKAVTEAVVVFFGVTGLFLLIGTVIGRFSGLYIALIVFQLGYGNQAAWMWFRSRGYLEMIKSQETARDRNVITEIVKV